jgi:hypothetical protein
MGMEEAPENGKESSHSARAKGMNEINELLMLRDYPYDVSLYCGYSGYRSWPIWKL